MIVISILSWLLVLLENAPVAYSWGLFTHPAPRTLSRVPRRTGTRTTPIRLTALCGKLSVQEEEKVSSPTKFDETTQKYGLEAGLLESLKSKDGGESAKTLLKKYGIAYLATSIPLAIISFVICYVLVDHGVDVASLLSKIGIHVTSGDASEKVGTFAIAYAAHKAASPIRFPPTVLLTPMVAKMIGKEPEAEAK